MSQTLKCAVCVANRMQLAVAAEARAAEALARQQPVPREVRLPEVKAGVTMFGGNIICEDHILVLAEQPEQPGDAARRAGLQV